MKKPIKTLLEDNSRNLALTPAEKSAIRAHVISFMDNNPVTAEPVVSPYVIPSRWKIRPMVAIRRFHVAPIALIVLLLLGSGLSAAAEETVPGDTLYFIKTNINENVKGWLALSDESKVELEAQIASTRLEEAEKLASQNKLSPEVKTQLVSKFKAHANNFKEGVKTLESQGKIDTAAGASSKFESSLNAHENVLLSLGDTSTSSADQTLAVSVAANVKDEAAGVSAARVDLEEKVKTDTSATSTEASAQDAQNVAGDNVATLTTSLATAAENTSPEVLGDAYAHLALATSTIAEADGKMASKDFADAFILYQKAHRIAGEVQITLDAEKKLKISVTSDFGDGIDASTATTTSTSTIKTGIGGSVEGTSTDATSTSASTTLNLKVKK